MSIKFIWDSIKGLHVDNTQAEGNPLFDEDFKKSPTFTCAMCGETFEKAWTDQEAVDEYHKHFPDYPDAEVCAVCDECWNKYPELQGPIE